MGHSEVELNERQRALHTYVVGQSGMGKSKAIETWVVQDILAGRGVGVIDPHGELYTNLLSWLSQRPELWRKIVLVDPTDPIWTIGFNPLQAGDKASSERLALFLTDVCINLWGLDTGNTPRLVWLLSNTFLALSNLGLNLLALPRFLSDKEFRTEHLARVSLPAVRQFFEYEFPQSESATRQWITPVLNKLGNLLFDPDVRLLFEGKSTLDFRNILDKQMVLLINLPKGIMSEGLSSLLAAFFVAHIQKAALSRTTPNPSFHLYLDEFQNYTTSNISDILAESRKYGLSLTLAHQYLAQLPNEIRHAVLNTAGNLVCFRVGFEDARVLAKEVFISTNHLQQIEPHLYHRQRGLLALPNLKTMSWEDLARQLATLRSRQFWFRRRGGHQPVKETTFWFPTPHSPTLHQDIQELKNFSGNRFGRRKTDLQGSVASNPTFEPDLPLWTG